MECQIGVISGDGIGPEIVTEAKKVLDQIGKKYGHSFHYTDCLLYTSFMYTECNAQSASGYESDEQTYGYE